MRGGEIGYESRETNRAYATIYEGYGRRERVGSDVEAGKNWSRSVVMITMKMMIWTIYIVPYRVKNSFARVLYIIN